MIERALSRVSSPPPIAFAVILLSVIFAVSAEAATVTIAWDPSPDNTVIGYQVYVGTSSRSYTETFDVGLATSFSYSPANGAVYYFAVASYSAGPRVGPLSSEVATAAMPNDGTSSTNDLTSTAYTANGATTYWSSLWTIRAQTMEYARSHGENFIGPVLNSPFAAPTVEITVPTPQTTYYTNQPFVTLGGRALDDGVIAEVTWTTNRGHSGRATGTENWIAGIPLERGTNTITVRARDEEGNVSSRAIVVNLGPRRSAQILR
jgi:hypothetical protein